MVNLVLHCIPITFALCYPSNIQKYTQMPKHFQHLKLSNIFSPWPSQPAAVDTACSAPAPGLWSQCKPLIKVECWSMIGPDGSRDPNTGPGLVQTKLRLCSHQCWHYFRLSATHLTNQSFIQAKPKESGTPQISRIAN